MQGSAQASLLGLLDDVDAEEVDIFGRDTAKAASLATGSASSRLSWAGAEFGEFRMCELGRADLLQVLTRTLGTHAQFIWEQARLRGAGRVEADAEPLLSR